MMMGYLSWPDLTVKWNQNEYAHDRPSHYGFIGRQQTGATRGCSSPGLNDNEHGKTIVGGGVFDWSYFSDDGF